MFAFGHLSTPNYDSLLIGWSQLNFRFIDGLSPNVPFHAGDSTYSNDAQAARDILEGNFNWGITDGGLTSP